MTQFNNNSNALVQSDYLYLQSAGSPGNTDGSASGIHLRWSLRGNLGDQHLPKGNLAGTVEDPYYTSIGFNKSNDFVKLYRRPKSLTPVQVNVNSLTADKIQDGSGYKDWIFSSGGTVLTFRFTDPNEYEALKQKHNLLTNPSAGSIALLNEYSGVVEVHVNKLFVGAKLTFGEGGSSTTPIRVEGVSKGSEETANNSVISHRKEVAVTTGAYEFFEENLQFIRFSNMSGYLSVIIYPYDDQVFGPSWDLIDDFSLTISSQRANQLLEDSPRFNLTNWPKYNDGARVVKANYTNRWSANNGIQDAVEQYLTLSKTDVYAKQVYTQGSPASSNGNDDDAKIELSVLDALKIMSLDYHIARMLGLGYIDTPEGGDYLYLAVYTTEDPLEPGQSAAYRDHYFMSLPVSRQEERPTLKPVQADLTFGLYYDQGQGQRTYITDSQGYAQTEDKRYVRVNLEPQVFPRPLEPFFADPSPIEASKYTKPVAYGVEYKNSGASNWISPELNHNEENPDNVANTPYLDNNGDEETEMIFFSGKNPLYLHSETSQGTHVYGVYGINWFSRASAVSNTRQETTAFPNRLKLLPPLNVRPQLIQHESPLIFTTSNEQVLYADNLVSNTDTTLLRVQLVIDQRHNIAHKDSDKIQFFFRQDPATIVEGKVKSVVDTSPYTCRVYTEGFMKASINTFVMPSIPPVEENHYIGSFLVVENEQYEIINVQQPTAPQEGPVFEVNKIKDNSVIPTGNQQQAISSSYKAPKAEKKFTAIENLLNPARWNQLIKEVTIPKFSTHQETQYLADGTAQVLDIGGIYEQASVQPDAANAGFYDITFNSYVLQDHPDTDVFWRGGIARIPLASSSGFLKELEVVEFNSLAPILKIKVYDNNYSGEPIVTGSNININLFPGYNIYLYAEAGFGESETLPATGEMTRLTYIATRTRDSSLNINSYISPAKPIIAKEVIIPKPTGKPLGNSYATRPNYYGKASYTFDTLVDTTGGRQPFALVFYRANTEGLLRALYKESTYQSVRAQLDALRDDPDYNSFWVDLINMVLVNNKFKIYSPSGFQFPNPDRVYDTAGAVFDASKDPGYNSLYQDMVRDKMMNAFVPLTEQPVLYMYLQNGKITSPKTPKIRDEYGNIIPPTSPDFDQAPMASKFSDTDGSKVRFTDYNLDGASQDLYFYTARELSNDYTFSAFSEVEKPVRILNTMPFSAPVIKAIESVPANPASSILPGVRFEIGQYAEALNVTHAKIYRAKTAVEAKSVRTMAVQGPFNLTDDPLKDEFADLGGDIPYGEPLFYRVVACKTIINETGNPELIDSLPSDILLSNVIDNSVPIAPELTATYSGPAGDPAMYTGVTLEWDKAVHNGSYFLYKMNSAGNWNKIHEITGDNSAHFTLDLLNTDLASSDLAIQDNEGNAVYHHFKLEVINASGLSSKNENILTLGEEIPEAGFSGFPTIIDRVGISVDETAETVTKTNAFGWNAGGFSEEYIPANSDGYVIREIGGVLSDNIRVCCGLSYTNGGADKASIDYSVESATNDQTRIEVNGNFAATGPNYQVGDKIKVERSGTDIKYSLISGGVESLIHSLSETAANPANAGDALHVDFSMSNTGKILFGLKLITQGSITPPPPPPSGFSGFPTFSVFKDVVIDDVAETITKAGTYGWNAGGFSDQSIAGDGYVERSIGGALSDNVRVCCGLSYSEGGFDKASINYAIESSTSGVIRVEVNGNFAASGPNAYQVGDKLRIERSGSSINFYHITAGGVSTQIHTLSETAANPAEAGDPLFVDFSMANDGKTLFGLNLVEA